MTSLFCVLCFLSPIQCEKPFYCKSNICTPPTCCMEICNQYQLSVPPQYELSERDNCIVQSWFDMYVCYLPFYYTPSAYLNLYHFFNFLTQKDQRVYQLAIHNSITVNRPHHWRYGTIVAVHNEIFFRGLGAVRHGNFYPPAFVNSWG